MEAVDSALLQAAVVYYAWEGHYHHMGLVLGEQLQRFGSDPVLCYWRAFGLVMEERLSDGMSELNQLLDTTDLQLAASLLLIYAHKQCKIIDKETVKKLETSVRGYRSTAGEKAMYFGGITLWLLRKHDKAREYTEKLLQRVAPKSAEGKTVRGWIDLTSERDNLVKKSIKYFDEVIQSSVSAPPLLAILGKARFYMVRYNFKAAMDVLQRTVTSYPSFLPVIIEKMRVELANQQWDSAIETANRCLSIDGDCIEAVKLLALDQCVCKGNMTETAELLEKLIEQLDSSEPRSHHLYYDISLGFARMAEGDSAILQHTHTLIERAISLQPSCADYTIELAHQALLKNELQDAMVAFRRAFSIDEMSIAAMMGLLHCQLLMGKTTEAEQQLEFLNELQPESTNQSYLSYLNALLSASKGVAGGVSDDIITNLLTTAATTHFNALKGKHLSFEYFKMANPDYVYRLAETMMRYTSSESISTSVLQTVVTILDPLAHTAPGLSRTMLLLAKVKYLLGESDVSLAISQQCASHAHCTVDALLLQATIHHHHGNTRKSEQALETALSNNFEVQQNPLYHLLKGRISRSQGNMAAALTSLQSAVGLIRSPPKSKAPPTSLPLSQQVTAFIELVHTLTDLGDQDQAASVMQETTNRFSGTPEEARVTISSAEVALSNGNTSHAIKLLEQITQDKPYYIQAREKMADVYLVQHGDKQRYLQCYQQLADTLTGSPTATLLGDAYLNVNEPDQALKVFERALRKNPRDGVLASRVGQVLVKTHQYGKAINYYETSLKSTNLPALRSDLADLYMRLSQYDKAIHTLQTGLDHGPSSAGEDLEQLMEDVQCSMMLARAHKMGGDIPQAIEVLHTTQNIQSRVMHKVSLEQPELMAAQQRLTASICCQLAELAISEDQDLATAAQSYDQALSHDPNNTETRLAAARLMMKRGLMDDCEQQCTTILHHDPSNEEALVLMADLLHHRGQVDAAIKQLTSVLDKNLSHFEALVRLIEMCWRKGVVTDANNVWNKVEQHCSGHVIHLAGLMYCKGLYSQYTGDTELALKSFNHARKDSQWGEKALYRMIALCLNPDNDILGADTLKPMEQDTSSSSSSERFDAEMMAVRTAEKLLKELRPQSAADRLKIQLLENAILLATRSKQNAEKALNNYTKLLTNERESVSILAGMATAHLQLKQIPRARNQLKRVTKLPWSLEEGAEFERSWLLMADVYVQSGKYDIAIDQLKKCITRNESCSKAWEYLGFISEREQAYKDAADHYEKAWRYSNCRTPSVGFRLAFNYMKARKFVEAVDVCHKVLQHHPSYPRIRKEVLDKARHNIRL